MEETLPQPIPVSRKDFKAAKRPKKFHYDSIDSIPRLPGPLTESEFYSQWSDHALVKGLPLVEEQDFLVGHCLDDGNCYWSAIAVLIYGSDQYWPWIKAQHYLWLTQVMENEAHPRYVSYRTLLESSLYVKNEQRLKVLASEPPLSPSAFNAIGMPNAWTSTDITPITADLYGINLIMFIMDPADVNKIDSHTPVLVKGHPNAPSRFMRFMNNNHFEPMRPDVPRPSDFRYPLINSETTEDYASANNGRPKQPHQHAWRTGGQPHGRSGVAEELLPRPVLPLPSESDLAFVIGQQATERSFTKEPGWLPPINMAQVELAGRDITRIVESARAVYHSWIGPSLLLECLRWHIAPVIDDPTRYNIEALLTHDRQVATRLVERAIAADINPPMPRTPQSGEPQSTPQPPEPKSPKLPLSPGSTLGPQVPGILSNPPGSNPTVQPLTGPNPAAGNTTASPQPKRNYGSLRKGDLIVEMKKRGLEVTKKDTSARMRWMLEADDLEKARESGGEWEGGDKEATGKRPTIADEGEDEESEESEEPQPPTKRKEKQKEGSESVEEKRD